METVSIMKVQSHNYWQKALIKITWRLPVAKQKEDCIKFTYWPCEVNKSSTYSAHSLHIGLVMTKRITSISIRMSNNNEDYWVPNNADCIKLKIHYHKPHQNTSGTITPKIYLIWKDWTYTNAYWMGTKVQIQWHYWNSRCKKKCGVLKNVS